MILAKTAMNPDRGPGAVSWWRATWRATEKKGQRGKIPPWCPDLTVTFEQGAV